MKVQSLLSLAVAAYSVSAATLQAQPQQLLNTLSKTIPGDSPVELCPAADPNDFILKIDSIDLSPNPPIPGEKLLIKASGTTNQTIEEGAYVILEVKWGYVRLIHQTADLCEQIANVDMECPVKDGKIEVLKEVDIPKEVPPGTYNVHAEVFDKDDNPITCLTAAVVFPRKGALAGYF